MPTMQPRPLEDLRGKLGSEWAAIRKAEAAAAEKLETLAAAFAGELSDDVSLVAYGSLARREWTQGSDLDWSLLIDGQYDPEHAEALAEIRQKLGAAGFKDPGKEGVFGNTAVSQDIVGRIGGETDTNRNTTQRILLLFESTAAGPSDAYDRVRRQIVHRYVAEDRGLTHGTSRTRKVPRFLLNDVVRYWRTVAVDYAYKQQDRQGEKWALRLFKLAMSRKLIFASGLATCFLLDDPEVRADLDAGRIEAACSELIELMSVTPLELVALLCNRIDETKNAQTIFAEYDRFLAFLDDQAKRDRLAALPRSDGDLGPLFAESRAIGRSFNDALLKLFFESDESLAEFTRYYGVF